MPGHFVADETLSSTTGSGPLFCEERAKRLQRLVFGFVGQQQRDKR